MSVSEVTLTASLEWSIIQNIAEGTVRRWSRRRPRPLSHSQDRVARVQAPHTLAVNNNLAFLETGLRQLLLVRLATKTLPRPIFDELQNNLKRLCRNLDQYVNPSLVAAAMKGNQGLADAYPQLRALCDALISRATSNMQETPDMDLVASPGHLNQAALFILPPDSAAKEVLELTVACNSNLGSLYQEQGSGYFRPTSPQKYPTATAFGQRAVTVLEALLEHFTACKSPHEVLLALSDNLDAANPNTTHPILDMVLSDCSQDCHRHEAQCLPYQREDHEALYQAKEIHDLCDELRERQKKNTLVLFFEHNALFNGQERHGIPSPSNFDETFLQSLMELVRRGAFRPCTREDFQRPAVTIAPRHKNILALKLAHCLSQCFHDTKSAIPTWDSNRIFLSHPPQSADDYLGPLYMSFAHPDRTVQPSQQLLGIGEPVLLAFAKLLLEIKLGEEIDLGDCKEPLSQWATLCEYAYRAELEGGGLYAEAVKGALYLPKEQPRSGEDPVDALKLAIRERILGNLATAANPPSAAGAKRRRSNSDLIAGDRGVQFDTLSEPKAGSIFRLPKRQRALVKRQAEASIMASIEMETGPKETHPPSPTPHMPPISRIQNPESRVSVFRIRKVTLGAGLSTEQTVREIIKANTAAGTDFNLDIRCVTVSRKWGAALAYFRGNVAREFKALFGISEPSFMTNKQDRPHERSMEVDANFIGLTQLYEPPPDKQVKADIFAIHGLNGHPYGSWLSKTERPTMWLQDYLPEEEDIEECRIMLYGYRSNFFSDRDHSRHDVVIQAERLATSLRKARSREIEKRPIIFIAHSYGGLVLARTLAEAFTKESPVHVATAALFLMACPMRNFYVDDIIDVMNSNDHGDLDNPVDRAGLLVRRLGEGDFLRNELSNFRNAVKGKRIFSFYETGKTQTLTNTSGNPQRNGVAVMAASANAVLLDWENEEAIPADKDHSNIVKFSARSDDTYEDIVFWLREVLKDCG